MTKRGFVGAAVLILCASMMSSCAKRYVGESISYSWNGWCHYAEYFSSGKKHCTVESGALVFDFDISKGEKRGEYLIEGTIDPTQGELKSWGHIVDSGTKFNLIVVNAGYVVDNISFRPRSATGNLGQTMSFKIQLTEPEGFDAVSFYWKMRMRG